MSMMLLNCELWWSFRKVRVGTTPSGWIRSSSSSPDIRRTVCTYFDKHWPTYWPNSSSCFLRSGATCCLTVAGKKINLPVMQKMEEKINIKAGTLYMCDSYIFLDWHWYHTIWNLLPNSCNYVHEVLHYITSRYLLGNKKSMKTRYCHNNFWQSVAQMKSSNISLKNYTVRIKGHTGG